MLLREVYPLSDVSQMLGVSVVDIVHLGIQARAQICVDYAGVEYRLKPVLAQNHVAVYPPCETNMPAHIFVIQPVTLRRAEAQFRVIHLKDENAARYDSGWWEFHFTFVGKSVDFKNLVMLRPEIERLRAELFPTAIPVVEPAKVLVSDEPLSARERNTLLTIIAALCDYSAIKVGDRGIAKQIEGLTIDIGARVTDDTIRKYLAMIPDALERRKSDSL